MDEGEAWAAYFYPGTRVLRNKLGIQDQDKLQKAERFLVSRRIAQVKAGLVKIPRTYDGEHLKAIHAHLFKDVYEFAGEYRNVSIGKRVNDNDQARWFLRPADLEQWLNELGETVREIPWEELNRGELVHEISGIHTYTNIAHPFREGSGRTARIYLEHILEGTGHSLDFDRVGEREWNEAARDSIAPGRQWPAAGPLRFEPQEQVFEKIVVDRVAAVAAPAIPDAVRLAQLDFPTGPQLGNSPTASSRATPRSSAGRALYLER